MQEDREHGSFPPSSISEVRGTVNLGEQSCTATAPPLPGSRVSLSGTPPGPSTTGRGLRSPIADRSGASPPRIAPRRNVPHRASASTHRLASHKTSAALRLCICAPLRMSPRLIGVRLRDDRSQRTEASTSVALLWHRSRSDDPHIACQCVFITPVLFGKPPPGPPPP
jgi:hypothetical protein